MEQQDHHPQIRNLFFIESIIFDPDFSDCLGKERFLKYFPKHLRSFPVTFYQDGHFQTRLKHLKLIRTLSWKPSGKSQSFDSKLLRLTIANKRKTIKKYERYWFDDDNWHTKSTFQERKMLPNLTIFDLPTPFRSDISEESWLQQTFYLEKTCYLLQQANNLKHLLLCPKDEGFFPSLEKLNLFEKTLSRLETLGIEFYWLDGQDHLLFQSLLAYKNILRYLTSLKLDTLEGKPYVNVLNSLLDLCPQLSYLSFKASPEGICPYPPPLEKLQEDVGDLKSLQNLTNLKELNLAIFSNLKFIEHCKFPKSLVKLSLYFSCIGWEPYYMLENSHQDSPFKSLFEDLTNLKSLKITLTHAQPQENEEARSKAQKEFLRSLICEIPKEAHLTLSLTRGSWSTEFFEYLDSLDLKISWEHQQSSN